MGSFRVLKGFLWVLKVFSWVFKGLFMALEVFTGFLWL